MGRKLEVGPCCLLIQPFTRSQAVHVHIWENRFLFIKEQISVTYL